MFTHFLKSSDQLVFGKCLHICKSLQTNLCLGSGPPLTLSLPLPFDVLDEVFTFCLWHVSHGTVSLFKFWLHVHPQEKQSWRSWQSWRACRKIRWVYPVSYQGPDWRKWMFLVGQFSVRDSPLKELRQQHQFSGRKRGNKKGKKMEGIEPWVCPLTSQEPSLQTPHPPPTPAPGQSSSQHLLQPSVG